MSFRSLFRKSRQPDTQNYAAWSFRFVGYFSTYAIMWSSLVFISFPHIGDWQQLCLVLVLFSIVAIPAPIFCHCQPVAVLHPAIILLPGISLYLFGHSHLDKHSVAALVMLTASCVLIAKQISASRQILQAINDQRELESSRNTIALMTKDKHIDPATGLLNAEGFREYITQSQDQRSSIVAICFRAVNELYAMHSKSTADQVVWSISQRMQSHMGPDTILCHAGFGEFLAFVASTNPHHISETVQDIARPAFLTDAGKLSFKVAIGAAQFVNNGKAQEQVMDHAIVAMRHALEQDGNQFVLYNDSLANQITQKFTIRSLFKKALNENEFELYLQPKIAIHSSLIKGAEALVRWNSPELGFVSPAEFIPIAESTGDIIPLGQFVLEEAARLSNDPALPQGFMIAVNVSSKQLSDPKLMPLLESIAANSPLQKPNIEIEITESVLISDSDAVNNTLAKIRDLGYRIALDDFGTGYSSLSILTRLHADTIKLDKSFIDPIPTDSSHSGFVSSIIDMAHSLNLEMVAEGIESAEQLDWLAKHHCDIAQGYFFAKPLAFKRFTEWLNQFSDESNNENEAAHAQQKLRLTSST